MSIFAAAARNYGATGGRVFEQLPANFGFWSKPVLESLRYKVQAMRLISGED